MITFTLDFDLKGLGNFPLVQLIAQVYRHPISPVFSSVITPVVYGDEENEKNYLLLL
jgi:hypothetical protein